MEKGPVRLCQHFEIQCDSQEYVDDETQVYHISIHALGTICGKYQVWNTTESLLSGYAVVNPKRFWFEERRAVRHPPGMKESEAIVVLNAVFEHLKRGRLYDGDISYMPIDLTKWLQERLPAPLAAQVDLALRAAVINNNAMQKKK